MRRFPGFCGQSMEQPFGVSELNLAGDIFKFRKGVELLKKILAIGNSFSEDATYYLKKIADSAGIDLKVVNLYIGGCSLELHDQNIACDAPDYEEMLNGAPTGRKVSIRQALESDRWDVVTVQQVSSFSGIPESYEPFGARVLDYVKAYAPQAKIYFHATWAYEIDSDHPAFSSYQGSQTKMYEAICQAASQFASCHQLPVIPSGSVIQKLRETPCFDYPNRGPSLCRDGFHMSMDYGRYAVALCWYEMLVGDSGKTLFVPEGTESEKIHCIRAVVKETCEKQTVEKYLCGK